jgi:hypothetical protein
MLRFSGRAEVQRLLNVRRFMESFGEIRGHGYIDIRLYLTEVLLSSEMARRQTTS